MGDRVVSHEVWLALGWEHWRYILHPDELSFDGVLLSFNPVILDQGVVRAGS